MIRFSSSNVCSTNFSRVALHPLSTSICESPARRSIFASHADEMVPLCQIFHLWASFRPILSLDFYVCNHGWTQSELPSVLNCIAIHNTRPNSSRPTMPRLCIFLFAGNLPSGRRKKKKTAQGSSGNFAQRPLGSCNVKTPLLELNDHFCPLCCMPSIHCRPYFHGT